MENKNILKEVKQSLNEIVKVTFDNYEFALKVGVNEDPNKQGIKVQFVPTSFSQLSKVAKDDIAMKLETKIEEGLKEYGIKVERDRELKDGTVIGFFIYIEYIHKIIRQALK